MDANDGDQHFSLFELSVKVDLNMKNWNLQNNCCILYSLLVLDVGKNPSILSAFGAWSMGQSTGQATGHPRCGQRVVI